MLLVALILAAVLPAAAQRRDPGSAARPSAQATAPPASGFRCGNKRYCREMTSCEEAHHHLRVCGLLRLDADRDGVPCEISHCPHTR